MVQKLLLVGAGGFVGSAGRYFISDWMHRQTEHEHGAAAGTFVVNIVGCLLIGLLYGMGESRDLFTVETRLFIFVGCLGGFTTFSAFGLDTFHMLRQTQYTLAFLNITAQILLGFAAVWTGYLLGK